MSSITDIAKDKAIKTAHTTQDALVSRSFLYPPFGALFFLRHPAVWPPVLSRILPCLALSVGVLVPMFFFTYVPQAAVLTFTSGPAGVISAVALVFSESAVIINTIARSFLLQGALVDLFDATLLCEGQEMLVAEGRELHPGSGKDGAKKLGNMLKSPLQKYTLSNLVEYFMLLPLNLIPVVGTAIFLIVQGRKAGPGYHARYFQLKGFSDDQRNAFIKEHQGGYLAFGTMTMVMNLIPLASILFTFTSTIGAALWAAEIEKGAEHPGQKIDVSGKDILGNVSKKEL